MTTTNEPKSEWKEYIVTLRFQFPAWDEKDGIECNQTARSKADAIRYARSQMRDDGHIPAVGKGRATFTASEVENS